MNKKLISINGDVFTFSEMVENPEFSSEFDRLSGKGTFSLDEILYRLYDMGIDNYIERKTVVNGKEISSFELFSILKSMDTRDLVFLLEHIKGSNSVRLFQVIERMIENRVPKLKMLKENSR